MVPLNLKLVAIIACALALLTIPLEWLVTCQTKNIDSGGYSFVTVTTIGNYLYMETILVETSAGSFYASGAVPPSSNIRWYGWVTLVLIVLGAMLAIVSIIKARYRKLWLTSGISTISAVAAFLVGTVSSRGFGYEVYPSLGVVLALLAAGVSFFGYWKTRKPVSGSRELQYETIQY